MRPGRLWWQMNDTCQSPAVILSASEAAEMILRVDDVIKAAPRKREEDPRLAGH